MKKLRMKVLAIMVATFGLGIHAQTTFEEISADLNKAGGKRLRVYTLHNKKAVTAD